MENITVEKKQLIAIVQGNRDNHRAKFEAAYGNFKVEVEKQLRKRLEQVHAGKVPNLTFALPVPMDHTKDYDRVLRMLELSVDDQIVLSEYDSKMYVMDEWDWSSQFAATTANYGVPA